MFTIRTYESEELQKIWAGYIEGPGWVIFIPANGGLPVIYQIED